MHNQILDKIVSKSLRNARVPTSVEDITTFRQSEGERCSGSLRMGIVTSRGSFSKLNGDTKNKALLTDLTITSAPAPHHT